MDLVMVFTHLVMLFLQLATAARASNLATENPTFPYPSPQNLAHCNTTCGKVTNISFPFGFQPGCSRPGFELICNHSYHPPRLFFADEHTQVDAIDVTNVYIVAKIVKADNLTKPLFVKWDVPDSNSFMISPMNSLFVIGCDIDVFFSDPSNRNDVWNCSSYCPRNFSKGMQNIEYCDGIGCCSVLIPQGGMKAYQIEIIRHNESPEYPRIKAFVTSSYYYFNKRDLLSEGINGQMNVTMAIKSYIPDIRMCSEKSLKDKATYACVDKNSECVNASRGLGYYCQCSNGFQGNPYVPDGCQGSTLWSHDSIIHPKENCIKLCGKIDVPFPFGLEPDCYRNEQFHLNCDNKTEPPVLKLGTTFQITKVLVNKGRLRFMSYSSLYDEPDAVFYNLASFLYGFPSNWIEFTWVIDPMTCKEAARNKSQFACVSNHSRCVNIDGERGYRCQCSDGYEGNPYILNGCTDVNECKLRNICEGKGRCVNSVGSHFCCLLGGTEEAGCFRESLLRKSFSLWSAIVIGVSSGLGLLLLFLSGVFLYRRLKKENQKKIRQNNFRKNEGLLLEQLISSNENIAEKTKIFSLEDLEKATNKFDETRVLGHGGHGTIYKGILSDQRVVAIKKAKRIEQSEINQFINEVAILTQINHRNIVKLFGCCLETEVPLLVYEFISSGTLDDKLHGDPKKIDHVCPLSLEDRIKIATEAAGALSYLHSAASISIFHRDVKSSNILLDDNHTAKVSDFGSSRSVPIDQSCVLTLVQGTFGYLDPQYYYTGQLSEKSDVYSFGVILVELLLRKRPIFTDNFGEKINLCNYFRSVANTSCFMEVLDSRVLEESNEDEINDMVRLAEMCLKMRGEDRPTMKEVEMRLQALKNKRQKEVQRVQVAEELSFRKHGHSGSRALFASNSDVVSIESLDVTQEFDPLMNSSW